MRTHEKRVSTTSTPTLDNHKLINLYEAAIITKWRQAIDVFRLPVLLLGNHFLGKIGVIASTKKFNGRGGFNWDFLPSPFVLVLSQLFYISFPITICTQRKSSSSNLDKLQGTSFIYAVQKVNREEILSGDKSQWVGQMLGETAMYVT